MVGVNVNNVTAITFAAKILDRLKMEQTILINELKHWDVSSIPKEIIKT